LELRAVVLHLLGVPAAAQPQLEASVREQVEARDGLGRRDRVALDDQTDAGADPELLRRGRRGGQRDERVQGVLVLLRQLLTAGERAAPAGGNVRVLGHPQRLVVARLGLARQLVDADRVLGGEDAESDLHCRSSWGLGTSEKCVWVASQRPWRRSKASVQRPGRGKVPPPGRVPSESQVAAIQPRSPATAPRALSTATVKSRITGHTRRHCSFSTTSSPSTNGATVPKATMSGAQSVRPPAKSTARTQVCQARSQSRSGARSSAAIRTGRSRRA